MPRSPAQRHRIRTLAAQESEAAASAGVAGGDQYEQMLAQLAQHERNIRSVQSRERRLPLKEEALREYDDYVQGVLEADTGAQDDVLMTVMVWSLDVGDIERAMPLAEYALRHGLGTPERYQRNTATLVAEEIAEAGLREAEAVTVDHLVRAQELTQAYDMPDEVRAKLFKASGLAVAEAEPERALSDLRRAVELHDKVGVKKDIERLERRVRRGDE